VTDRKAPSRPDDLVSIVIPTFNRSALLPRAVDACLNQTHRNLEVIVVNDGSRDDTDAVGVALAARDPRVQYLRKENSGISDTLNCGFAQANGRFLSWTSDDNFLHPQAVARMVAYLRDHREVGFVYADARTIDPEGRLGEVLPSGPPEAILDSCVVHGCLLYRREVMEAVGGYDPRWIRSQDYDYYLRVSKHTRLGYLAEILYDYGIGAPCMSTNHEAHVIEEAHLLSHHMPERRRLFWARAYHELARSASGRGSHLRALWYAGTARLLYGGKVDRLTLLAKGSAYLLAPSFMRTGWRQLKRALGHDGGSA